jgi:hypothetical protein
LIFHRSRNGTLTAHVNWVNIGKIWISSSATPFINNAKITLKNRPHDPSFQLINKIKGKKMLLVTGGLQFYGMMKSSDYVPLLASAKAADTVDTVIMVAVEDDWLVGS